EAPDSAGINESGSDPRSEGCGVRYRRRDRGPAEAAVRALVELVEVVDGVEGPRVSRARIEREDDWPPAPRSRRDALPRRSGVHRLPDFRVVDSDVYRR